MTSCQICYDCEDHYVDTPTSKYTSSTIVMQFSGTAVIIISPKDLQSRCTEVDTLAARMRKPQADIAQDSTNNIRFEKPADRPTNLLLMHTDRDDDACRTICCSEEKTPLSLHSTWRSQHKADTIYNCGHVSEMQDLPEAGEGLLIGHSFADEIKAGLMYGCAGCNITILLTT
ncbi:hypothetical protein MRB53_037443 [Persea americana]|nr:hypothetical protein MRB53_037443 [Persea americana]